MHTYILITLALLAIWLMSVKDTFLPGAKWSNSRLLPNHVRVYAHVNFTGKHRDFPAGTFQRSLSKGFLGTGLNKENDTYSSIFVPRGLMVEIYEHNDFKGRGLRLYPGNHYNLGKWNFNDKVSSLMVKKL